MTRTERASLLVLGPAEALPPAAAGRAVAVVAAAEPATGLVRAWTSCGSDPSPQAAALPCPSGRTTASR